jgi:16S rRNA U1498 N3-methylase RsmE
MSKYIVPLWVEKKLIKKLKRYENPETFQKVYEKGFKQCFDILWPKINSMEYTLKILEAYAYKDISELTLQETTKFEKALIQVRTTLKRLEHIK